jgi:hypothetical protein
MYQIVFPCPDILLLSVTLFCPILCAFNHSISYTINLKPILILSFNLSLSNALQVISSQKCFHPDLCTHISYPQVSCCISYSLHPAKHLCTYNNKRRIRITKPFRIYYILLLCSLISYVQMT